MKRLIESEMLKRDTASLFSVKIQLISYEVGLFCIPSFSTEVQKETFPEPL